MDLGLKGKAALVTGGSSGIGLATARRLLAEGAKVAIVGRDAGQLDEAAKELRRERGVAQGDVATVVGDVAFSSDVKAIVAAAAEAFGRLDIVVSNAGTPLPGDFDSLEVTALEDSLKTKVLGTWELVKQAAPHLRKQTSGRVVVVIDQAGKIPAANTIVAGITAMAQHAFVKALSDHLAKDNILVTAVCPSHIQTPTADVLTLEGERYLGQSLEHQEAGWGLKPPLGRMGAPEDVANAIAFLVSDRASFLCGTNLDVDGGFQRMIF